MKKNNIFFFSILFAISTSTFALENSHIIKGDNNISANNNKGNISVNSNNSKTTNNIINNNINSKKIYNNITNHNINIKKNCEFIIGEKIPNCITHPIHIVQKSININYTKTYIKLFKEFF